MGSAFPLRARRGLVPAGRLERGELENALVFTRTKHRANRVADWLGKRGIVAARIHGNRSQKQRTEALAGFKSGRFRVLVATDVAARGIHVEDIDTVINFDIPNEPETYVHRVGRTGRLGARGTALSLCGADERGQLASIERLTRRKIQKLETPIAFEATPRIQPAACPDRERRPHARRPSGSGAASRRRSRGRGRRPNSVSAGPRPV